MITYSKDSGIICWDNQNLSHSNVFANHDPKLLTRFLYLIFSLTCRTNFYRDISFNFCYFSQDIFGVHGSEPIWAVNSNDQEKKLLSELEKTNLSSPVSTAHEDIISAMALLDFSQSFLITGSRDGIIKVWK